MLQLVTYPTRSLQMPSEAVTEFGAKMRKLAEEMNVVMIHANGIGLAAPQVGENWKIIIVKIDDTDRYATYVNPKITFFSGKKIAIEEGCLSLPGIYGFVERAAKIRFSYYDTEGKRHIGKARGMEAIVLQHEVDHIEGRLIIDTKIEITKGADRLQSHAKKLVR